MISPHDKVVCIDEGFQRPVRALFSRVPVKREVCSVRDVGVDPATGELTVRLVGYFAPLPEGKVEPGLPAKHFRRLSGATAGRVMEPDLIQMPVAVCRDVAKFLKEKVPLFPQVEDYFIESMEGDMATILRKWKGRR